MLPRPLLAETVATLPGVTVLPLIVSGATAPWPRVDSVPTAKQVVLLGQAMVERTLVPETVVTVPSTAVLPLTISGDTAAKALVSMPTL